MSFLHNYLSWNSLKKNLELQLLLRMEMEIESKYLTITDVQLNSNISGTKNDEENNAKSIRKFNVYYLSVAMYHVYSSS